MKKNYLKFLILWSRVRMTALLLAVLLVSVQKVSASAADLVSEDIVSVTGPKDGRAFVSAHLSESRLTLSENTGTISRSLTSAMVQRIIRGKVTDGNGESLPGVSVQLKGTTIGAVTDSNGEYSLTIPGENGTLVFSFLGFATVEAIIGLSNTVNATLTSSEAELDEFVVVGYGSQKKIDVTGAVGSVQAKDLVMTTSPDVGQLLKGKLSGLVVVQNSAQPGGGLNIQIRGATSINASNDPLVVVDGFPISNLDPPANGGRYVSGSQSILNSFNPNDIESITVLKDASATSIYGARAANGVLLITTKPGVEGKPKITYSGNSAVEVYNQQFDTFSLKEWMAESNRTAQESWDEANGVIPWGTRTRAEAEADPVNGLPPQFRYTQAEIDAAGPGTNWVDLITRNGQIQQHNLSLSGGSRSSRYYFSGNVYDNAGVVRNSDLKRYSLRMNLAQDLSQYVKLGINLTASKQNIGNVQLGDDLYENSSLIKSAIDFSPAIQAIDENGNYPLNPEQGLRPNPYSMLAITDKSQIESVLFNTTLDVTPIKNVTVQFKAGIERGTNKRSIYQPKTTFFGNHENGIASVAQNENNNALYEINTTYIAKLGENHNFTVLGGISQQKFKNGALSLGNTAFITDAFLYNNIGAGAGTKSVSSSLSDNMVASYYGRLNYGFKDKYLVTLTVRKDGSSVFSKNHKWATFPSAAIGWNMDNESWFAGIKPVVSRLKLRLSYGQVGNASIGNNAFAAYSVANAWLGPDDEIKTAVMLSRLENPDLKWETTTEGNAGMDFSLFNDRVEGSVELYHRVTDDLLNAKPLNSYNYINTVTANIGSTESKGYEISLTTYNINKSNFQWRTRFALSHNSDNWVKRAEGWVPAIYENEKDPIRAVYSSRADGILQIGEPVPAAQPLLQPGQIKIRDVDGLQRDASGNPVVDENGRFILTGAPDGRIDEADTKLIGRRDPKYSIGFQNILTYKNISLNFDFNGLLGRDLVDPNFLAFGLTPSSTNNTLKSVLNRWTPDNPSTTHPSAFGSSYGRGDFFRRNASFLRLQDVLLGYTFTRKQLGNLINSLQVNVGANNLFVLTGYKGVDPETDAYAAAYPNVKRYSFGINATF